MQAKALGLRIASLLNARSNEQEAVNNDSRTASPRQKKRYKIVIHSSPYLRCVQTSIAAAAGISQSSTPVTSAQRRRPLSPRQSSGSPNPHASPKPQTGPNKILLRLDACFGEWLNPQYYEHITPPPESVLMVKGAKSDLLREDDHVEVHHNASNSQGYFPGGWAKTPTASTIMNRTGTHDSAFPTMSSLAQALQHRERSSSQSSVGIHTPRFGQRGVSPFSSTHKIPDGIYDPPVPTYAVSPSEAIPRGYVAHAAKACVNVDYHWDSMHEPQQWGDGGEYGDSWPAMHKRFRKGLAGLMSWYAENGPAENPKEEEDDDEELVVVIVTHGAGCVALLTAITGQPMVLPVGVASLSMATRRKEVLSQSQSPPIQRRPSLVDLCMANEYELSLIASDDHLRTLDPSGTPEPSPVTARPTLQSRRRFGSSHLSQDFSNTSKHSEQREPVNSSLGSIRRTQVWGPSSRSLSNPLSKQVSPSPGLWSGTLSPPPQPASEGRRNPSPGADMVSNFRQHTPPLKEKPVNAAQPNGNAPNGTTSNSKDKTNNPSNTYTNTPTSPKSNPQPIHSLDGTSTNGASATSSAVSDTSSPPSTSIKPTTTTLTLNTNIDTHLEKKEENDDVPPLPSGLGRTLSQNSAGQNSSTGLWSPKPSPTPGVPNLWGSPRLAKDDITERSHELKRRWTMSRGD